KPQQGTTFALHLPLSLAVMRILLFNVANVPFALTASHVAEIIYLSPDTLIDIAGLPAFVHHNEFIPLTYLGELLRLPPATQATKSNQLLVIIVKNGNEKLGMVIDQLLDEHDMVIKPLPEHLRQLKLVSGMVLTGRSELVSVLQAAALIEQVRSQRGERHVAIASQKDNPSRSYRILVVDDSISTREIEKDVLQAHGYQVTLAEDGIDGLHRAQRETFDAVLTDVEMPRLDGFSLTAKLRQLERYQATPIIIVTSRAKEADRRRGIEVGADAYIVKGDFDQQSLLDTLHNLLD
ncbi:MAG: response regulator, partial [Gammaproteobacteria bacterium]|nr:response regulator [Gammaproteobacteria bacterium]